MIKGFIWEFPAKILDPHDGDTIVVDLDQGVYNHRYPTSVRVLQLYCAELATPDGARARDFAARLLPAGMIVKVVSKKLDKRVTDWGGGQMTFTRILGDIWYQNATGFDYDVDKAEGSFSYAVTMVAAGLASSVPAPGFGNS